MILTTCSKFCTWTGSTFCNQSMLWSKYVWLSVWTICGVGMQVKSCSYIVCRTCHKFVVLYMRSDALGASVSGHVSWALTQVLHEELIKCQLCFRRHLHKHDQNENNLQQLSSTIMIARCWGLASCYACKRWAIHFLGMFSLFFSWEGSELTLGGSRKKLSRGKWVTGRGTVRMICLESQLARCSSV